MTQMNAVAFRISANPCANLSNSWRLERLVPPALQGLVLGALMLLLAGTAQAAGSSMPWEGPLQQVVQSITGPVVQAAAVVAVVVFGAGIAMSENGSSMRKGLSILFGLCIAFAASTLLKYKVE